jgi:copper chaperone CopZ
VHTIQNEIGELSGVKSVIVDENTRLVTIAFDDPATQEKIQALMAEIGYPVEA